MKPCCLYILILLVACKPEQSRKGSDEATGQNPTDTAQAPEPRLAGDEGAAAFEFVNDEIGGDPFRTDLRIFLPSIGEYDVVKQSFQNLHDSTKTDTIMTIRFGSSVIEYFQGQQNGFIISAEIRSPEVPFKKGIAIGMDQEKFRSLFPELRDVDPTTVTITTLEGLANTEFLFADRKLVSVRHQSYFD
jgi:hypothetical protein